ncbi:MAG: hypothetical protein BWY77_00325 [bacterium ADurb.Bin431]|nr:MAG: hypothetical protein BWY77_00325 [bacterium ADurb.Bin431]
MLWEWAGEIEVILARSEEEYQILSLSELLPHAFDHGYLPNA